MRRREFIALIGGVAAWPLAAHGQHLGAPARRIAVLLRVAKDDPDAQLDLQAFRDGLQALGWSVDKTILIECRYASADPAQMDIYAAELIGLRAEVILASGSLAVAALRRATQTTPIVFVRVADPLSQKFIASLAHPGGNVTGFTSFGFDMSGKWLELLKGTAQHLRRVGLIFNLETAPYGTGFLHSFESAAKSFGIMPVSAQIHDPVEIDGVMSVLGQSADGGLIVIPDAFTDVYRDKIITLATRYRVPTIYGYRNFTATGGLMSYGVKSTDIYRRAATYVDRILKGEKAADLPVQRPTSFELTINLKTAKTLGITVPQSLLVAAAEVIE